MGPVHEPLLRIVPDFPPGAAPSLQSTHIKHVILTRMTGPCMESLYGYVDLMALWILRSRVVTWKVRFHEAIIHCSASFPGCIAGSQGVPFSDQVEVSCSSSCLALGFVLPVEGRESEHISMISSHASCEVFLQIRLVWLSAATRCLQFHDSPGSKFRCIRAVVSNCRQPRGLDVTHLPFS